MDLYHQAFSWNSTWPCRFWKGTGSLKFCGDINSNEGDFSCLLSKSDKLDQSSLNSKINLGEASNTRAKKTKTGVNTTLLKLAEVCFGPCPEVPESWVCLCVSGVLRLLCSGLRSPRGSGQVCEAVPCSIPSPCPGNGQPYPAQDTQITSAGSDPLVPDRCCLFCSRNASHAYAFYL